MLNRFRPMITIPASRFWKLSTAFLALSFASFATAQTPLDPPVKPTVAGKFVGNGKNAAIKFVMADEHEPFGDKEAITLLFTEKDPTKVKKPTFDAMFGELGSAVKLSVDYDGKIFGCDFYHTAHSKKGISAVGKIKMIEFKIAGGNVTGHVSTGEELDAFGEKWDVDLTFAAPLPAKLRNAPVPKPVVAEPGESTEPAKKETKAPTGPLISVKKLPLPKDAAEVEFKELVKQIHLTSPRSVEAVSKELSANLKQQGWKEGNGSLMGKQNAILKREQGDAKLTIMIQPAGKGSTVKIFTEGLDWTGSEVPASTAPKKEANEPSIDDIEAEAQKALKDALKGLPKGL